MNKAKLTQKQINQLQLIRQICAAAKSYKTQLVGKTFLYIFDDRYIEVMFKVTNFRHLTRVESSLSAREFYNKAVRNQLQTNQISFSSNHPYELCLKKITHITDIANLAQSESFKLEEITTQSKTYKFGTTDLNFSPCLDLEYDNHHNPKGPCCVAQSLLDEDCFSRSKSVFDITHIFAKRNDEKLYSIPIYPSQTKQPVPETVKALLSGDLLNSYQCL